MRFILCIYPFRSARFLTIFVHSFSISINVQLRYLCMVRMGIYSLTYKSNIGYETAVVVVIRTARYRVRSRLAVHVEVCQSGSNPKKKQHTDK